MKTIRYALLTLGALTLSAPAFADEASPTTPTFRLQTAAPKLTLDPSIVAMGAATSPAFHLQLAVAATEIATPERTTIFGLPLNMGPGDRILRGMVAVALISVATWGLASGEMAGWASGVVYGVSAIPTLTAATGYCPLYHLFGLKYSF